jgi:hypothetical protein
MNLGILGHETRGLGKLKVGHLNVALDEITNPELKMEGAFLFVLSLFFTCGST